MKDEYKYLIVQDRGLDPREFKRFITLDCLKRELETRKLETLKVYELTPLLVTKTIEIQDLPVAEKEQIENMIDGNMEEGKGSGWIKFSKPILNKEQGE